MYAQSQIIQARNLSILRHSRTLSPEDFIFLIRYDRAKVNRLRTYLSWKDVRKNAKEDGGGGGAGDVDINATVEDVDMAKAQGGVNRKLRVKLPWEISSIYSDYIVPGAVAAAAAAAGSGSPSNAPGADAVLPGADDDLDDDDQEAMRESLKRLKEADDATLRMTREEYEHYSECRAASFTFRKAKKFRDFISSSTYLDVRPNDDIVDVLGFLAFEVVREITLGAKEAWHQENQMAEKVLESTNAPGGRETHRKKGALENRKRKREHDADSNRRSSDTGDSDGHRPQHRNRSRNKTHDLGEARGAAEASGSNDLSDTTAMPSKDGTVKRGSPSEATLATQVRTRDSHEDQVTATLSLSQLYSKPAVDLDPNKHLPDPSSFCGLFSMGPAAFVESSQGITRRPPGVAKSFATESTSCRRELNVDGPHQAKTKERGDGEERDTSSRASGKDEENETGESRTKDEECPALLPHHIREAFARLQRKKTRPALSSGTKSVGRGPLGGLRRTRMWVI